MDPADPWGRLCTVSLHCVGDRVGSMHGFRLPRYPDVLRETDAHQWYDERLIFSQRKC